MVEKLCSLFEAAGFESPEAIANEAADKFALKTGIGIKKARALKEAAESYLQLETQVLGGDEVHE
jgi:N utilization substance protein A